jgi:hypothetical protein
MATLEAILDARWDGTNVTKPTIQTGPEFGPYLESRVVHIKRTMKIEDYMGIQTRTKYTVDTHDAYLVTVGTSTKSDTEQIVDEIRRICAEFAPTSADKILQWEGGDWDEPTTYWHSFTFVIMKKKSGISLPNT